MLVFGTDIIPTGVMKTAIVSIIKHKTGDTSDKNYISITLVTATSKLLKFFYLKFYMCIFTVKSIIKYYSGHNTPLYTCFLDASKDFDRVNHWILFTKLINNGISLIIVRILVFGYQTQQLYVKWGGLTSICFTISSGVRQGGILSPKIFALYMNGLTD